MTGFLVIGLPVLSKVASLNKAKISLNNATSVIIRSGGISVMRLISSFSLIFFVERRNSMGLTDDEIVNVSKTRRLRYYL